MQGRREGHLGITTGCSWQRKASWVLTAPARSASESTLKYTRRMAHCEKCHTTSGVPSPESKEGSESAPLEERADVNVEEEGGTPMKDNYNHREKEVFIRTNPRPEGPHLHFVKSDLEESDGGRFAFKTSLRYLHQTQARDYKVRH